MADLAGDYGENAGVLYERQVTGLLIAVCILLSLLLYLSSLYSYILFHTVAELVSIIVAFTLFLVTWYSRKYINNYLVFVGIAYAFIAGIDIVHTLSYKGMNIFTGYDANLPTQLWIIARALQALTLAVAPFTLNRRMEPGKVVAGYAAVFVLAILSVFVWHNFPTCYIEGVGLTQFKIGMEYIISAVLVLSAFLLYRQREAFDKDVLQLLYLSICATIISEIAFTLYIGVYDFSNFVGHIFKILAFGCLYLAIIDTGIRKPYAIIFRELKQSEGRYKELINSMRSGVAVYQAVDNGADFVFLDFNRSSERIEKIKRDELIGRRVTEVFPGVREFGLLDVFSRVWRTGQPEHHPVSLYKDEQIVGWRENYVYRLPSGEVVAVYEDVTDKKQADKHREHLIKELAQKNAELDRFTYTVSHDLKSPLLTIRGFLHLLAEDVQKNDAVWAQEDMKHISSAAEKMERLITTLLELSRSGRSVDTPVRIPLKELVLDTAGLLDTSLRERNVTLVIPDSLPDMYGDRERLLQVMTNLISNAVRFMGDQKEPRVEIGVRREPQGPLFFVRDNGMGIQKEDQSRIFGLFERLNPDIPGTGIGLATVRRIIEAHGGKVWVESEGHGKGATFWFTLPGVPAGETAGPDADEQSIK